MAFSVALVCGATHCVNTCLFARLRCLSRRWCLYGQRRCAFSALCFLARSVVRGVWTHRCAARRLRVRRSGLLLGVVPIAARRGKRRPQHARLAPRGAVFRARGRFHNLRVAATVPHASVFARARRAACTCAAPAWKPARHAKCVRVASPSSRLCLTPRRVPRLAVLSVDAAWPQYGSPLEPAEAEFDALFAQPQAPVVSLLSLASRRPAGSLDPCSRFLRRRHRIRCAQAEARASAKTRRYAFTLLCVRLLLFLKK